jgi:hypothetical protein
MPSVPRRFLTRRTGAVATSACALVLCVSTPAVASNATGLAFSGARQAHAGASARLQATLSALEPSCDLYADATILDRVVPRANDLLVWTLRLPRHARAQALILRLSCGAEQARAVLHVLGPARGEGIGGIKASVRQVGPALLPSPASEAPSEGEELPSPALCTDASTCPPVNAPTLPPGVQMFPLSEGECAVWAEYMRPDIYYHQAADDPLSGDWDGWTWAEHAQAEGLAVSGTPEAGGLAVWPQSADMPYGHVAYVVSVSGDSLTISEMNAPFAPVALQTPDGYTYYEDTLSDAELAEQSVQFVAPAS